MFLTKVKIVITSLLIIILYVPFTHTRSSHNTTVETEFNKRLLELKNWNCSTPKPKLVYVGDENSRQITPHSKWIPQEAILHRCEKSLGCCENYPLFTCKPSQVQEVSVLFKKIDMLTGRHSFERLRFSNHTACSCQSNTET